MRSQNDFTNIIGGKHTINQNVWALSLVRKVSADHAYLIMEGINESNERIVMDAHLVVKGGSNNKKAHIVYRNLSHNLEELQKIGESCSSYTWNINRFQSEAFISLVQAEEQRANEDKINYVQAGKAKITGIFASLPEDEKASLGDNVSTDVLFRDGHNCGSWAIAMVRKLELPFKGNYVPFLACIPKSLIQGQQDGDAEEPETQFNCFMM